MTVSKAFKIFILLVWILPAVSVVATIPDPTEELLAENESPGYLRGARRRLDDWELPITVDVGFECFSAVDTVEVQDKGTVTMKDLKVGDMVRTGKYKFQPVYAFSHRLEDAPTSFLQLVLEKKTQEDKKNVLEITSEHMIHVEGRAHPVRAGSVQVGDSLWQDNRPVKVVKIGSVTRPGLYAPLTPDGNLLVNNGILASVYSEPDAFVENGVLSSTGKWTGLPVHFGMHFCLSPYRMMCLFQGGCEPTDDTTGMPSFLSSFADFGVWAIGLSTIGQIAMMILVTLVFFPIFVLEKLVIWPCLVTSPWTVPVMLFATFVGVTSTSHGEALDVEDRLEENVD